MSEGNPHQPSETTVTIKYGKEYDKSWAVFRGDNDSLRHNICDYFGMNVEDFQTLHDVVGEATALAHASQRLASGMGARSVKKSEAKADDKPASSPAPAQKADEPAEENPLLDRMEACKTRAEIQKVWAGNRAEFDANPELMAAYKRIGKELPAG